MANYYIKGKISNGNVGAPLAISEMLLPQLGSLLYCFIPTQNPYPIKV